MITYSLRVSMAHRGFQAATEAIRCRLVRPLSSWHPLGWFRARRRGLG
nr:MAG TPA: hypothetical protein [Caudoviricetes sp.]